MARYEHLPIYKAALDVAVYLEKAVAGFSRYHKYSIGVELRECSRRVVRLIMLANSQPDKQAVLLELRGALDELLLVVRLAKEIKAFSGFKSYQHCVIAVTQVCKQNEGWLASLSRKS